MSAPPAEDVVAEGLSALKAVNAGIYNTAWHAEQMWPVDEIVAYWCRLCVIDEGGSPMANEAQAHSGSFSRS